VELKNNDHDLAAKREKNRDCVTPLRGSDVEDVSTRNHQGYYFFVVYRVTGSVFRARWRVFGVTRNGATPPFPAGTIRSGRQVQTGSAVVSERTSIRLVPSFVGIVHD